MIHFFLAMPYRATEKTEARKAETRERIVAAALEQVAEGGYASASVQSVAERAGVAVGTVYRHFPSKAGLFAEVFRRASQRELDVMSGVAAADDGRAASERIAAAAEVFCRRALAGPVLAYALLAEPVDPAVEAERLRFRRGYRDMLAAALRQGVEAGEIAPHDPEVLGAALTGGLGEALVGPLAARRRSEALVASLVQFVMNSISATDREHARAHA